MKIKHLSAITDKDDLVCEYNLTFSPNKSIHVLHGDAALSMTMFLASFTGDYSAFPDYPSAILHSEVTVGQSNYRLCVLHEEQGMRISANFDTERFRPNHRDTDRYVHHIEQLDRTENNLFFGGRVKYTALPRGESTRILFGFENWLTNLERQAHHSEKPLYIVDLLDYLDDSIDLAPLFDRLANLHREVFLTCYTKKEITHPRAEMIFV